MLNRGRRRSGFTLPEVLVTVAIIAVLAAIVVPTVTSQISKGDEANLASGPSTLQTGITAFVSDVRKFPSRLQHLLVKPAGTDDDITGTDYSTAAVARWRGPYLTGSLKAASATLAQDSIAWGLAYALDSLSDTSYTANNGGVGITLGGVTSRALAARIDSLLDGGTDSLAGTIRWHPVAGGAPANDRVLLVLMGSQ